jgi:hypothetical protein
MPKVLSKHMTFFSSNHPNGVPNVLTEPHDEYNYHVWLNKNGVIYDPTNLSVNMFDGRPRRLRAKKIEWVYVPFDKEAQKHCLSTTRKRQVKDGFDNDYIKEYYKRFSGGKYPKNCCAMNCFAESIFNDDFNMSHIVVGALGYKVDEGVCLMYGI